MRLSQEAEGLLPSFAHVSEQAFSTPSRFTPAPADGLNDSCLGQSATLVAFSQHYRKGHLVQDLVKRWLKSLRTVFSEPKDRPGSRRRPATRLLLEELEPRLVPAVITTIAGNGSYGYGGDNGPATSAMLYLPFGTAVDSSGNVFIADTYNNRIREVVKATGNIVTVAGTGDCRLQRRQHARHRRRISTTRTGVAVDASGNLFIADTYNNRIREVVKATGNIITIAGNGATGYSGDGGPATSAHVESPRVAWPSTAPATSSSPTRATTVIREVVKATGIIVTVAGTGTAGYSGDNGPATAAQLNQPNGVAVDASGDLFIADCRQQPRPRGRRRHRQHHSPSPAPAPSATAAMAGRPPRPCVEFPDGRGGGLQRQPLHRRFEQRAHPRGGDNHPRHHDRGRQRHVPASAATAGRRRPRP